MKNSTTTLHIKIDQGFKKEAEKLADTFGITMTALVNMSLRETVKNRRVVLEDTHELRDEIAEELLQADEDYKKGINWSPAFNSVEEMMASIDKQK
ncbi:MAG: hypothetical protein WC045_00885 [Patescibacteria group bacterium]